MSTELLDYHNVLLKSIFSEAILEQTEPTSINQVVSDFDNVKFHISTPESKTRILLSLSIKCWRDLVKYGVEQLLAKEYGPYITGTEPGYDFSLLIDLEQLPQSLEERTDLVDSLSLLRRNAMAAPFELAYKKFDRMNKEAVEHQLDHYEPTPEDSEVMAIHYRDQESIYIRPSFDRVTVIFSTLFRDETDQVFGKVFLQEFVDGRKRALQNAPQVLFSKEPPLELRGQRIPPGSSSFITFILFPAHLSKQRRAKCISHIQTMRDYFHYHIKCSKAYVHSRMRYRTDELLKVLNRAKPENVETEKETSRRVAPRRFPQHA